MERYQITIKSPQGSATDWMLNVRASTPEELDAAIYDGLAVLFRRLREIPYAPAPGERAQLSPVTYEPTDEGRTADESRTEDGTPVCPAHDREMAASKKDNGYYCTARDESGPRGYCRSRWTPERGFYQVGNGNQKRQSA